MTIRYTCTGCESVLKIKDEKAGTKGKCPKCKTEFLVPQPSADDADGADETAASPDLPVDMSVDMPIELTPEVPASAEFDPADYLSSTGSTPAAPSYGSGASERKPSVAELMRDFEATKKKDKDKGKKSGEVSRPAASTHETSGSAADALTRAYQQKRETASAPSVSQKDVKSAEDRAAMMTFLKTRLAPGVAVVLLLLYCINWYFNHKSYEGPPLYRVYGVVKQSGKPLANARISFECDLMVPRGPDEPTYSATGTTDEQGNYELYFEAGYSGAPAGSYVVGVMSGEGVPVTVPDTEVRRTVTDTADNKFDFNL
ncbi:MAG: hypothetical protein U0996_07775 [Planctomycetaceae bacterium]